MFSITTDLGTKTCSVLKSATDAEHGTACSFKFMLSFPFKSPERVSATQAQQTMSAIETGNYAAVGFPPGFTGVVKTKLSILGKCIIYKQQSKFILILIESISGC